MKKLIKILKSRNLFYQQTEPLVESNCLYVGFDPTADSLHFGHLLPLIVTKHALLNGYRVVCLLGEGTAHIGDPTGKITSRPILSSDLIQNNTQSIRLQLEIIFENHQNLIIESNISWLKNLNFFDFLNKYGPHISINKMMRMESVVSRLKNESNLSFKEFCYSIMQGYDFLRLNEIYGCSLQIGGADQFGNIISGIDLIRKVHDINAGGITVPLLLSSNGEKMGKTSSGTIWLNENKTSNQELKSYILNLPDEIIDDLLFKLTFLSEDEWKDFHPQEKKKLLYKEVSLFLKQNIEIIQEVSFEESQDIISFIKENVDKNLSNNKCKKLIEDGAISLDGEKILNIKLSSGDDGKILQITKRFKFRLKIK